MSTTHLHHTTTATPEQFVAGLTDFGPGRSRLFPSSADGYLTLHELGPTEADITEGSGGVWDRLHYGYTYTFTRHSDGTTDVDYVVVREGKNLKGQVLRFVLRSGGRRSLRKAFGTTVKAIEARNSGTDGRPG
jgi:hypothetical protein